MRSFRPQENAATSRIATCGLIQVVALACEYFEPSRGSQTKTSSWCYSFLFLFVLLGSNQLQPILNSLFAAKSRKPDRLFSVPLAAWGPSDLKRICAVAAIGGNWVNPGCLLYTFRSLRSEPSAEFSFSSKLWRSILKSSFTIPYAPPTPPTASQSPPRHPPRGIWIISIKFNLLTIIFLKPLDFIKAICYNMYIIIWKWGGQNGKH